MRIEAEDVRAFIGEHARDVPNESIAIESMQGEIHRVGALVGFAPVSLKYAFGTACF